MNNKNTFNVAKSTLRHLSEQEITGVAGADVTTSNITEPTVTVQTVTVGTGGYTTISQNQTK